MIRRWLRYRVDVFQQRRELRSLRREQEMAELRHQIAKAQRMEAEEQAQMIEKARDMAEGQ